MLTALRGTNTFSPYIHEGLTVTIQPPAALETLKLLTARVRASHRFAEAPEDASGGASPKLLKLVKTRVSEHCVSTTKLPKPTSARNILSHHL